VLDTLAAAEAAAGDFGAAVATARRALDLVSHAGADSLARGMRERTALYQRHMPYTERPMPSPGR
jgi:hypothetical protein